MPEITREKIKIWLLDRKEQAQGAIDNEIDGAEWAEEDLAIIDAILAALEPKISRELIEKWLEKNAPLCTCDEAYTGRGLTAPDCLRHRGLDAEDLIRMLKELGLAALEERTIENCIICGHVVLPRIIKPAALAGPEPVTEGERKHLLWRLDWLRRFCGKINTEIGGGRGLFVSGDCCPVCPSGICKEEINQIRNLILSSQGGAVSPDTQVSPHGETGGAVRDKWERDRLWCSALVHVLGVEDVAKVTGYFNSIRPDPEAGTAGREGK